MLVLLLVRLFQVINYSILIFLKIIVLLWKIKQNSSDEAVITK